MKIRVGSRKSDLAQIQSRIVAARLKEIIPSLEVEFVFKDVGVDLNLGISLVEAESKGLFTKDLSTDLIEGKIDLVVHSWKDLPTTGPEQTVVAATLEREDPRDLVFIKKEALKKDLDKNQSISFLSSSPRREHNLGDFVKNYVFPEQEIKFIAVRGNLPTRMNKFLEGNDDALVLALAAVKRLLQHGNEESKTALKKVLETSQVLIVPVTENPPAPAQGALAIEVRKDRKDLIDLLGKINHKQSFVDVIHERERLKDFGGGCHLKLGIYQKTTAKGVLKVERGLSPKGNELSLTEWNTHKKIPSVSADRFFDAAQLKIFDRKKINSTSECKTKKHVYLVSKAEALPEEWVSPNDVVWVAGLETWKKLRAKGYWVSGSFESLGETFQDVPYELWPDHMPLKLAHTAAVKGVENFCATYELVRNSEKIPSLEAYDLFFWPSGSLFLACMKEQPAIREKHHVCGLGNTFDELSKHIPADRLYSVLNRDCLP